MLPIRLRLDSQHAHPEAGRPPANQPISADSSYETPGIFIRLGEQAEGLDLRSLIDPNVLHQLIEARDEEPEQIPFHAIPTKNFEHLDTSEETLHRISSGFEGKFEQTPYEDFYVKLGFAIYSRDWEKNLEELERAVHADHHEQISKVSKQYDEIAEAEIARAEQARLRNIFAKPLSSRERKIIRLDAIRPRPAEEAKFVIQRDINLGVIQFHRDLWRGAELKDAILDERRDERDQRFEQLRSEHEEMLESTHVPLESIQKIVDQAYALRAEFGSRVGSLGHYMVDKVANQLATFVGLKASEDADKTQIGRVVIDSKEQLARTRRVQNAEIRFENELSAPAFKELIAAATAERINILTNDSDRLANLTPLGRLTLMIDPESRYHQALKARIDTASLEKAKRRSYQADLKALDSLATAKQAVEKQKLETQPTKQTKKSRKTRRAKNQAPVQQTGEASVFPVTTLPVSEIRPEEIEQFTEVAAKTKMADRTPADPSRFIDHRPQLDAAHAGDQMLDRNIDMGQIKEALDKPAVYGETREKRTGSAVERRWLSWKKVAGMDKVKTQPGEDGITVIHLQPREYVMQNVVTSIPSSEWRAKRLINGIRMNGTSRYDRILGATSA